MIFSLGQHTMPDDFYLLYDNMQSDRTNPHPFNRVMQAYNANVGETQTHVPQESVNELYHAISQERDADRHMQKV
jgi:hypothetical protein